jgi:hypothetical protein
VLFVGIHLGALVADNFTHIAWREILIPYAFDWKPGAVTLGIVAFYLLVAVQVSSWLRPRLPRKVWKATHMLSYPAMWLVAMHGLKAGTDASNLPLRISVMVVVGLTSFFTLLRVLMGRTARRTATPVALPAPVDEAVPEPANYVVHVQEAMDSLRDALHRMHQANAEHVADPNGDGELQVHAERRREARTLVDDVPPSL